MRVSAAPLFKSLAGGWLDFIHIFWPMPIGNANFRQEQPSRQITIASSFRIHIESECHMRKGTKQICPALLHVTIMGVGNPIAL